MKTLASFPWPRSLLESAIAMFALLVAAAAASRR